MNGGSPLHTNRTPLTTGHPTGADSISMIMAGFFTQCSKPDITPIRQVPGAWQAELVSEPQSCCLSLLSQGLKGLDDTFEIVAAEYDDNVVGDLDEDPNAVGAHEMSAYESVLDDFLRESGAAATASSSEINSGVDQHRVRQNCSTVGQREAEDDDLEGGEREDGEEGEDEGAEASGGLRIRGSRYNNHGSVSLSRSTILKFAEAKNLLLGLDMYHPRQRVSSL